MGAIFGLLQTDGSPTDIDAWRQAAAGAARYGVDGLHLWRANHVALGRAVNLVRARATPSPHGLADDFPSLHGVASVRLDNRDELLARLDLPKESADIALILAAYARWGEQCPERLHGDFAFAVWDTNTRRLFCARDRVGMRPFYYRRSGNRFAFASALPLMAHLDGAGSSLDAATWAAHFARRPVAPEASYWRNVLRLPPGCSLLVEGDAVAVRRYWTAHPAAPGCRTETEWAEAARALLGDAVARQGADTSSVGLMLSGGLDSSFLLGLSVADRGATSVRIASSVLPEGHAGPEVDERPQLAMLRHHFSGLDGETVSGGNEDPLAVETWADIWSALGRPANLYHPVDRKLMGSLAAQGARVALSGFWGDGTLSYRSRGWASGLWRQGKWGQAWATAGRLSRRQGTSPLRELAAEIRHLLPRRPGDDAANGLEGYLASSLRRMLPPQSAAARSGAPRQWLPEILSRGFSTLEEQAVAAATQGVELACPYLDAAFLEFILAVPPEIYVAGGHKRGLARLAMQGFVPEEIRLRTDKQPYLPGFSNAARAAWPHYRAELVATLAQVALSADLGRYLDLAELNARLQQAPPAGSGFGREGRMLSITQAMAALRFLEWKHHESGSCV